MTSRPCPSSVCFFTLIAVAARRWYARWAHRTPAQQQAVVSGTVSEQGSLQPIAQALVRVAGTDNTVTTNQSGRFRIENVALGTRELQDNGFGISDL